MLVRGGPVGEANGATRPMGHGSDEGDEQVDDEDYGGRCQVVGVSMVARLYERSAAVARWGEWMVAPRLCVDGG